MQAAPPRWLRSLILKTCFPLPPSPGVSATQNIFSQIWIPEDEIVSLQALDTACFPACSTFPGQSGPTAYNFFMPQFSSLWGWRTSGNSSYNALNLTLRHVFSAGIQFDVNYTYSKSIDVGSNAERINLFDTPTPDSRRGVLQPGDQFVGPQPAPRGVRFRHDPPDQLQLGGRSSRGPGQALWRGYGKFRECRSRRLEPFRTVPLVERTAVQHFPGRRLVHKLRSHR